MKYQAPKIDKIIKANDFLRESFYAGSMSKK